MYQQWYFQDIISNRTFSVVVTISFSCVFSSKDDIFLRKPKKIAHKKSYILFEHFNYFTTLKIPIFLTNYNDDFHDFFLSRKMYNMKNKIYKKT